MHKTFFLASIAVLCLLAPMACEVSNSTFLPSTKGSPDFILQSVGEVIYEGDDGIPGETPVQTVDVTLGSGVDAASITYRNDIETSARQTRNNILFVAIDDRTITVVPTIIGLPSGIIPKIDGGGRGLYGTFWQQVIEFGIVSNINHGKYNFKIDININGTDYGTIPYTINIS